MELPIFFTVNKAVKDTMTNSTVSTTASTHAKALAVLATTAFAPSVQCQPVKNINTMLVLL